MEKVDKELLKREFSFLEKKPYMYDGWLDDLLSNDFVRVKFALGSLEDWIGKRFSEKVNETANWHK